MDNKLDDQLRELRDIFDGPIAAALRARDQELAQAREETTRLKAKLERTKEHHAKQRSENAEVEQQVFDEIAQELDKARAERDAAVEALTWYRNQKLIRLRYEQGGISEEPDAERVASEALASLPHATERAQALEHGLEESVKLQSHYAELLNMYDGGKRMTFPTSEAWLARLDALESGGG